MLPDWIKGQIAAIESGILSFEGAFLGQIMLPSGETVLEWIEQGGGLMRIVTEFVVTAREDYLRPR